MTQAHAENENPCAPRVNKHVFMLAQRWSPSQVESNLASSGQGCAYTYTLAVNDGWVRRRCECFGKYVGCLKSLTSTIDTCMLWTNCITFSTLPHFKWIHVSNESQIVNYLSFEANPFPIKTDNFPNTKSNRKGYVQYDWLQSIPRR